MDFRTSSVAALALALTACSKAGTVENFPQALDACSRGARSVEIRERGIVTRVLGTRQSTTGTHEGFLFAVPMGRARTQLRVEDNVDITGPIPLHRGERIELQGQLECNDLVIHWTHHDPSGHHVAGYIAVNGRVYQ